MWILQKHHVLKRRTAAELTDGNQETCQHILENRECGHVPDTFPSQRGLREDTVHGSRRTEPPSPRIHAPRLFRKKGRICAAQAQRNLKDDKRCGEKRRPSPAWRSGLSPEGLAEAPPDPGREIWKSGPRHRPPPGTEVNAIAETDKSLPGDLQVPPGPACLPGWVTGLERQELAARRPHSLQKVLHVSRTHPRDACPPDALPVWPGLPHHPDDPTQGETVPRAPPCTAPSPLSHPRDP